MDWLEKNLKCLENEEELDYHKLYDFAKSWKTEEAECFTAGAKDGSIILGVFREEKQIMLNSTYRPMQEAEKFAKKIQLTDNSIIAFMGIGNGIIVKAIAEQLNEEAQFYIYEPSKELFAFVMQHFDLSEILSDKRIKIFVDGINEQYFDLVLAYNINNVNIGVTILETHPKYKELFPEKFEGFSKQFKDCKNSALVNLKTIIERQKVMVRNAILNVADLVHSKMTADFIEAFPKDMPAILVSGGPSLDKNYEVLKQAKGKALIIAVDRTAKYLLDRDIVPDLFCSLDYRKSVKLFQDERLKQIPFLYMSDLNHAVLNVLGKQNLIFGTTSLRFYNWLIGKCGKKGIDLPIGGSVATLGYSFAKMTGFHRLILVGQDLALTGGAVYAGGMVSKVAGIDEYDMIEVPGNVEDTVITRGDYYVYLKWFEQAVKEAKESGMEVVNATEGGAKIEGTEIMSLQEAINQYCQEHYDIEAIFQGVEPLVTEDKLPEVTALLEEKRKELPKLKKKAKDAAELARRCGVLSKRGDYGKEFKEKNKLLSQTTALFDESPAASLLSSYAEGLLADEDIDLYVTEDDNQDEMIRLYRKMEKNYQYIDENADEAIALYDSMLEALKASEAGE
ncbi:MAG: DUF115 domain-containing protein [Lachnospiraceae bacterium]|nr:DUF115 domain-containing protein [Lachnospiraceae bacterium]